MPTRNAKKCELTSTLKNTLAFITTKSIVTKICLHVREHIEKYFQYLLICGGHIGLYTPINYFGRYATCSHKDGGRSHIQSRETIGQEDHVTCLKLRPRVNSRPAFGATYKMRIFYKYVVFKRPFSLLHKFFTAATHSLQRESTGVKSNNMDGPRRHSKYTLTMRRFPV